MGHFRPADPEGSDFITRGEKGSNRVPPHPSADSLLAPSHLPSRMRAFQGVFHQNPDYALWYGWSEMVRDLSEITEMAAAMRLAKGTAGAGASGDR